MGTCDPFVRVTLLRERRSLRGSRCSVVCEFLTRTLRHTKSPNFNQTFGAEIVKTELKVRCFNILFLCVFRQSP